MAAEGDLREALKKRVEAYGGEVRAVAWLGRRHAPDVLCLLPGTPTRVHGSVNAPGPYFKWVPEPSHPFIETKAPKKGATAGQKREHERMRKAGCTVLVINSIEALDDFLPPL